LLQVFFMSLERMAASPLTEEEMDTIIEGVVEHVTRVCQPHRAILFGSAARGTMSELSDVDLIVLSTSSLARDLAKEAYYRDPYHLWPIDALFFTEQEFAQKASLGGVCFVAAREGKDVLVTK
jgi:predicted nucleotidyltransferase